MPCTSAAPAFLDARWHRLRRGLYRSPEHPVPMELFGPEIAPLAAIACIASYLVSGRTGIYHAQRMGHSKHRHEHSKNRLSRKRRMASRPQRKAAMGSK